MSSLVEVRPEDFVRAGVVLGRVAEDVAGTIGRCRSSAEVRWVGRPNQRYQQRLGAVMRDLGRVRHAYDQACEALLAYARAMESVVDLAVRADLLDAEVRDLAQARRVGIGAFDVPMTVAEQDARDQAMRLRALAEQEELLASGLLAGILRDLAGDAPRVGGWTTVGHAAAKAAQGFGDQFHGTAVLAAAAFRSAPMVGDARSRAAARRELWAAAKAVGQPWLAIEEILDLLEQGQYSYAGGAVGAGLVLKSHTPMGKKVNLYGWHDDLPEGVLAGLREVSPARLGPEHRGMSLLQVQGWLTARAQTQFLAEVERFASLPAPSVEQLLQDGVNLVQHEALGGHTIYKHVGRDVEFLRRRQEVESAGNPGPVSAFLNEAQAQRLVRMALQQHADEVRAFVAGPDLKARFAYASTEQGLLIRADGQLQPSRFVVIVLRKDAEGEVRIQTAFLSAND